MNNSLFTTLFIIFTTIIIVSCGETTTTENNTKNDNSTSQHQKVIDSNANVMFSINGSIFSIPSPIQTAIFISGSGAEFNSSAINSHENADNYSSDFYKAINLGIYGADLSYTTIYEDNNLSLKYLAIIRDIASDIGLENSFDETLINRFSSNSNNKDSMLVFVSEAFTNADNYLKSNDKNNEAALILTGGWLEAMNILAVSYLDTKNTDIKDRIAQQKNTLLTVVEMLEKLGTSDDYMDLASELYELYQYFEGIEYSYEYVAPVTDGKNRVTNINSKQMIDMSDEQLNNIINKLTNIRDEITI